MTRGWWWGVLVGAALMAAPLDAVAQSLLPDETDVTGLREAKAQAEEQAKAEARRRVTEIVQAGPVDPAHYVLGPGDALELNLWGRIARTIPMDVGPEGRIFLPGRGPLVVSGRTLAWARDRILKTVAEQYVGVGADVQLVRLRTFIVYVAGEVKDPGAVQATSAMRASEVIERAEPLDGASHRNILIRHAGGDSSRADLEGFERLGRQELNPMLVDGDVIVVPHAREFTSIAGAVARPLRLELAEGDQVRTLVDFAGGLITSASPERAFMVRFVSPTQRESLLVDLRDPDVGARPLRDGDRLFVQFLPEYHFLPSVEINGEVEHPGAFPIVLGRSRLSELLGWAGGFRPTANRAAVHLIRELEAGKQQDPEFDRLARLSRNDMTESEYTKLETKLAERKNSFTIDWGRVTPGSASDPLLQDRDVVRVDRFVPTVRIEGQVKRPGYVDYSPGRTLGQYIQLAGGFTDRSARTSVRVTRSLTGQIIPARSLRGVQPGDFIWVPERRDIDAWTAFRDIITVAGQVAVVIFTLSRQ